ncbi:transposase [Burkholderia humptydooensis]|uniref:transposase n=1 Tax=Burkholderia humptydooensis TaxID=430531 RepID=UPI001E54998E|nr:MULTISPECIES: transposase [Burkholderia]
MIATAVIAAAGSATESPNRRQFAAWLGLPSRQHSSGGKDRLFGITKRGNGNLRMLLLHGARAVARQTVKHTDAFSRWVLDVQARRRANGFPVPCAAHPLHGPVATNMLSQGTSFKGIAHVPAHESRQSTAIDARLDLPPLSPWPGEQA